MTDENREKVTDGLNNGQSLSFHHAPRKPKPRFSCAYAIPLVETKLSVTFLAQDINSDKTFHFRHKRFGSAS